MPLIQCIFVLSHMYSISFIESNFLFKMFLFNLRNQKLRLYFKVYMYWYHEVSITGECFKPLSNASMCKKQRNFNYNRPHWHQKINLKNFGLLYSFSTCFVFTINFVFKFQHHSFILTFWQWKYSNQGKGLMQTLTTYS